MKNLSKKIVIAGIFLVFAALTVGLSFRLAYFFEYKKNTSSLNQVQQNYAQMIERETNDNRLTKIGLSLAKTGHWQLAQISLEKATTLSPNFRDAWLTLGWAQLAQGKAGEAIESLKKAEEIDPLFAPIYSLLASGYRELHQEDLALAAENRLKFLAK